MAVAGNNSATHWASSCSPGIDTIVFEPDGLSVCYMLFGLENALLLLLEKAIVVTPRTVMC